MGMSKAQTQCLKRVQTSAMAAQSKKKSISLYPPLVFAAIPDWLVAVLILIPPFAMALSTEGEVRMAMILTSAFSVLVSAYWLSRVSRLTELASLLEKGEQPDTDTSPDDGGSA